MKKLFALFAFAAASVMAQTVVTPPAGPPAQIQATFYVTNKAASIASTNLTCPGPSQNAVSTSPGALIQASSNVVTPGVQCPAGLYRIVAFGSANTAGNGNLTITAGFKTNGASQTPTVVSQFNITPAGNQSSGSLVFWSDGTAQITFATTYNAAGTYDLAISLERIGGPSLGLSF